MTGTLIDSDLERMTAEFAVKFMGRPTVLVGLWLWRMPGKQRAETHLAAGVRHLMGYLVGMHQECCSRHGGPDRRMCR